MQQFPQERPPYHDTLLADRERRKAVKQVRRHEDAGNLATDAAVRLATAAIDAPVSLVSLIEEDRQVFIAQFGLQGDIAADPQTSLEYSLCQYVMTMDQTLAVSDARRHPLLRTNLAVKELGVVAYLGAPVHSPSGQTVGSICVIDFQLRDWTKRHVAILANLARLIEARIAAKQEKVETSTAKSRDERQAAELIAKMRGRVDLMSDSAPPEFALEKYLPRSLRKLAERRFVEASNLPREPVQGSIDTLLTSLLAPLGNDRLERIARGGADLDIGVHAIPTLSVILSELIAYTATDGALSGDVGWVEINWCLTEKGFSLHWTEVSRDSTSSNSENLSKLLELSSQRLGGASSIQRQPGGLRVMIDLPIATLRRGA